MEDIKRIPLIGISIGDLNGIGIEIIIKSFSNSQLLTMCTPVLYGSGKVFSFYRKSLDAQHFNFNQINDLSEVQEGKVNVLNCFTKDYEIKPGELTSDAGEAAFLSLQKASDDVVAGSIDALVTAPINKEAIQSKDFKVPGHTEYLTNKAGVKSSLMMMVSEKMRVALVTTHIPLDHVKAAITKDLIIEKVKLLNKTLKNDFGVSKPKIAVLGLNPHAGENGLLGKEEKEMITPALTELIEKNILAFGPFPADGFFGNLSYQKYDAVLAMYHDQGLTPFKLMNFDEGVNYTAGLPFVRTSPDHGTAFEIAGKGIAKTESFLQSIYVAIDAVRNRNKEQ